MSAPSTTPVSEVSDTPVLRLRQLRVRRGGFSVIVPEMDLGAGEVIALLGPSGCGKSTWMRGWLGADASVAVEGELQVLGEPWPKPSTNPWRELLAQSVTVLLQDPVAALDPLVPVGRQMAEVTGAPAARCVAALSQLRVEDPERVAASLPHRISGGQAQRALLAIAMIRGPRLLIADEPTAGLDGESIVGFVDGLKLLRETHGTAVLLATHDLSLVRAAGARPWMFRDGTFVPADPAARSWPALPSVPTGGVVFRGASLQKSHGPTRVLEDVDIELRRGEIVAVVGPSGSGKSTLARIVAGHEEPDGGTILVTESGSRAARQLLFQDAFASLTPGRKVGSLVAETVVRGFDIAAEAAALGLDGRVLDRTAAELSGGERRRVALLRALSVRPSLLVLDEPTQSLDAEAARAVLAMIGAALARWRFACLLITHDVDLATHCAQRILTLEQGRLR